MQVNERKELIANLRNQTELGRLNHDTVETVFAKMDELGYGIVRKEADSAFDQHSAYSQQRYGQPIDTATTTDRPDYENKPLMSPGQRADGAAALYAEDGAEANSLASVQDSKEWDRSDQEPFLETPVVHTEEREAAEREQATRSE